MSDSSSMVGSAKLVVPCGVIQCRSTIAEIVGILNYAIVVSFFLVVCPAPDDLI